MTGSQLHSHRKDCAHWTYGAVVTAISDAATHQVALRCGTNPRRVSSWFHARKDRTASRLSPGACSTTRWDLESPAVLSWATAPLTPDPLPCTAHAAHPHQSLHQLRRLSLFKLISFLNWNIHSVIRRLLRQRQHTNHTKLLVRMTIDSTSFSLSADCSA